jgi:hypothetical protein
MKNKALNFPVNHKSKPAENKDKFYPVGSTKDTIRLLCLVFDGDETRIVIESIIIELKQKKKIKILETIQNPKLSRKPKE